MITGLGVVIFALLFPIPHLPISQDFQQFIQIGNNIFLDLFYNLLIYLQVY